jgi:hypothetical protein
VSDWMTVRVVLLGQPDAPLDDPPGRVLLVHADHTFGDLAEAIDVALGRWDLSPVHRFDVEGRILVAGGDEEIEDSDEVTIGSVGLRAGSRFSYVFDLGELWEHDCLVEDTAVDPFEATGEEPDGPVAVFGWGTLPDQYGRLTEDDLAAEDEDDDDEDEDDEDDEDEDDYDDEAAELLADVRIDDRIGGLEAGLASGWTDEPAEAAPEDESAWGVVAQALGTDRPQAPAGVEAAIARLRAAQAEPDWPVQLLFDLVDLPEEDLTDAELWTELAAGIVAPTDEDAPPEGPWAILEPADWAGAVIELVRSGPGQPAGPQDLAALIRRCPEVEQDPDLDADDLAALHDALATVGSLWQALGALDDDGRLTELGMWGLPEALRLAWTT